MTRPRLLDLFCGAGGAAMGYHRAGFDVVGVDIKPQPNYPFEFHQADALTYWPVSILTGERLVFDAIHASPPCQEYSLAMRHLAAPGYKKLIDPIRELLRATGLPWVIENVVGAPLPHQATLEGAHGVMLCGTAFGMRVYRHRLFETNFSIPSPGCVHSRHAMNPHSVNGRRRIYEEFGRQDPEILWRHDMGVDWMNRDEAREAIPPAFTEFIGEHMLAAMQVAA